MNFLYFMMGVAAAAVLALLYVLFVFKGSDISRKKIKEKEIKEDTRRPLPCPDNFEDICSVFARIVSEVEKAHPVEDKEAVVDVRMESKEDGKVVAKCLYSRESAPVAETIRTELGYKGLCAGESLITDGKGWYETSSKHTNIHYKCNDVKDFFSFFRDNHNSPDYIQRMMQDKVSYYLPDKRIEECLLTVDTSENSMVFLLKAK